MKHKENEQEKLFRDFAEKLYIAMNWEDMPVTRFKIGNTVQWKGHCYARRRGVNGPIHDIFVNVSNNEDIHPTERDFWDSAVHEMIHVRLCQMGLPYDKSFGHGTVFKNMAKEIAAKFPQHFTYKRIMK
jgi:hypothetical protein